jgi:hypothetical protein
MIYMGLKILPLNLLAAPVANLFQVYGLALRISEW